MGQRYSNGQGKFYEIDSEKVYIALRKHGIKNITEFCAKAGHSGSWLSRGLKNGHFNEPMLVWLKFFGIEYDEIKPEPIEAERQEVKQMTVRELAKEDLKEIIRSAMLAALNAEGV